MSQPFNFCPKCGTARGLGPDCQQCGYEGAFLSRGEYFATWTFPELFKKFLTGGFFVSLFLLVRGHYLGIDGMINAGLGGMAFCAVYLLAFVNWEAIRDAFHRRSGS